MTADTSLQAQFSGFLREFLHRARAAGASKLEQRVLIDDLNDLQRFVWRHPEALAAVPREVAA